jgi:hypothetical protein
LATTEDISAEMEMFKDLQLEITHENCEPEEPGPGDPMMPPPEPEPCNDERSPTERANSMAKDAADEVFKEEQLETEEEKRVVYKMEIECDEEDEGEDPNPEPDPEPDPGNSDPEPEPEPCEPTELRMVFTSVRAGDLDIDVQLGKDKLKMLSVQLYEKSAGVVVDLADIQVVLKDLEDETETSTEGPSLPSTLKGKIVASLMIPGDGSYEGSFGITEAIDIASTASGREYRLQIDAVNPAGSLTINEMAKSMTAALNMDVLDLEMMTGIFGAEDVFSDGQIKVHIGGFGGSVTLSENGDTDVFQVNDINMGSETTYGAFNNERIVAIDLNENAGRKFSLTASNPEKGFQLGFSPELDFKIAFTLTSLFDPTSEDLPPDWLIDETFHLTIDGASLPTILIMDGLFEDEEETETSTTPGAEPGDDEEDGPTEILKVIDGLLTLKALKANKEVKVTSGQCLIAGDEPGENDPPMGNTGMEPDPSEEDEHLLDMLRAGACSTE